MSSLARRHQALRTGRGARRRRPRAYAGEVVALVGDNGAGKSTLIKATSGVQPADAGAISFDGKRVKMRTATDAYKLGIATVYQDLALCDNLDVVATSSWAGRS